MEYIVPLLDPHFLNGVFKKKPSIGTETLPPDSCYGDSIQELDQLYRAIIEGRYGCLASREACFGASLLDQTTDTVVLIALHELTLFHQPSVERIVQDARPQLALLLCAYLKIVQAKQKKTAFSIDLADELIRKTETLCRTLFVDTSKKTYSVFKTLQKFSTSLIKTTANFVEVSEALIFFHFLEKENETKGLSALFVALIFRDLVHITEPTPEDSSRLIAIHVLIQKEHPSVAAMIETVFSHHVPNLSEDCVRTSIKDITNHNNVDTLHMIHRCNDRFIRKSTFDTPRKIVQLLQMLYLFQNKSDILEIAEGHIKKTKADFNDPLIRTTILELFAQQQVPTQMLARCSVQLVETSIDKPENLGLCLLNKHHIFKSDPDTFSKFIPDIERLIQGSRFINDRVIRGTLEMLIKLDALDTCKLLLECGYDFTTYDSTKTMANASAFPPIYWAVHEKKEGILKWFLESIYHDKDIPTVNDLPIVTYAAVFFNYEALELLSNLKASLTQDYLLQKNSKGQNCAHIMAQDYVTPLIKEKNKKFMMTNFQIFIAALEKFNAVHLLGEKDENANTPLHYFIDHYGITAEFIFYLNQNNVQKKPLVDWHAKKQKRPLSSIEDSI